MKNSEKFKKYHSGAVESDDAVRHSHKTHKITAIKLIVSRIHG